ncbi:MAG: hypothetical protein A2270_08305 [Elusimicrobia bacterium RIFOXYA12_FULL_51_18]|nr:MAG: hypothetical protein A2270_08305 [Elusimicrobia bacterium RIFOXYA12_FULL_51_18]OGS28872.1 MAG: hypothetical protein A2218_09395 [Elusimicrobia bacterium RIFOXYA2_FULL_53_38]
MPETELTKEQKKKISGALYFGYLAFYLISVDAVFSDLYLIVVSGVKGSLRSLPAYSYMASARPVMAAFMFLLITLWYSPIRKFTKTFDPGLKPEIRAKISHIYRDLYLFFALSAAVRVLVYIFKPGHSLTWELFLKDLFPAMILVIAAQLSVSVANVDSFLARVDELVALLYEKEELYKIREGTAIPLFAKVALLVSVSAIIPFLMLYAASMRGVQLSDFPDVLMSLVIVCVVTLVLGLTFILKSVQRPLEGLISKMGRVSKGDYNVKTRIYFADEVARLKAGFNEMVDGLKEREELRDTFGRYMSIEIARELLKNKKVNLGGEHLDAAVMFCDIRNFTPLSEKMSAAQVVEFLNNYFSYITPPITANFGVISKFMGDAVMAVYTPMLGSVNYAADSVRSALAMREALAAFNASGKSPGEVRFGIGIQTGGLVAGNIGTLARLEYTFIGDTVNIASRLESKTKELGTDILISRSVLDKIGGILDGEAKFEGVGLIPLKGKAEPIELYKVLPRA